MTTQVSTRPAAEASRPITRGLPFAAVLGVIAGFAILLVADGGFRDVDVYWHTLAGAELAAGNSPADLGTTWSFAPDPILPWVSTQWIGEWLFHLLQTAGGWAALAAYRVVTAALVIGILAHTTLRGRPSALAGVPFAIGVITVAAFSQERTQQLTYIGAALLGGVIVNGLIHGRLPRWWVLAPTAALWANIHGGWVLMPAALALVAAARLLDHGPRDSMARRGAGLSLITLAAGAISPAGPANVTAVFRFAEATDTIQEWQPVTPTDDVGTLSLLLWIVAVLAWARSTHVPRGEMLITIGLFVAGWTAWRSIVVAVLMVLPLVAHRLAEAFPRIGQRREPAWSARIGIGVAAVLGALGLLSLPGGAHLPADDYPFGLYARVAELPPGQRVLNQYDLSGMVLWFGGDGTKVGIDGRTDRYGPKYIEAYNDLQALRGDWEELLETLAPTAALLDEDAALAHVLVAERGWRQLGDDEHGYVLLVAQGSGA